MFKTFSAPSQIANRMPEPTFHPQITNHKPDPYKDCLSNRKSGQTLIFAGVLVV